MQKKNQTPQFFVRGYIKIKGGEDPVPGIFVNGFDGKNEIGNAISNDDGGFEFAVNEKFTGNVLMLKGEDSKRKKIFDRKIDSTDFNSIVMILVDGKNLVTSLQRLISIKPKEGRIFPKEKLLIIYSAVNLYGGTKKQYFFDGPDKPGLTCPFPELENYQNVLFDAWGTVQGDIVAKIKFRDSLDAILLQKSTAGKKPGGIDFFGKKWNSFVGSKNKNKIGKTDISDPIISLESSALLMMAANFLGNSDKKVSNHYMNIAIDQIASYFRVSPIYKAANNAINGDVHSQQDVRSMIHVWGEDCRGHGGLPDFPDDRGGFDPSKPMDPHMEDMLKCLDDLSKPQANDVINYSIDDVSPADACPGDTLTITGSGFKNSAGKIKFRGNNYSNIVKADPITWTDTEIKVVVPAGAFYGPVDLEFPFRLGRFICGSIVSQRINNISRTAVYFTGNIPVCRFFQTRVNGVGTYLVEENDSVCEFYFQLTDNSQNVRVTVKNGNQQLYNFQGLNYTDTVTFNVPNRSQTTVLDIELRANNGCGERLVQTALLIHKFATNSLTGMEITQATQFYKASEHIPNNNEHKADNSVQLISHKDTLVRVYFITDQVNEFNNGRSEGVIIKLKGLRGSNELEGSPLNITNSTPLVAINDTIVTSHKKFLLRTANFILPRNWTDEGSLRLIAELHMEPIFQFPDKINPDANKIDKTFNFKNALKLRCVLVRIKYTGEGSQTDDAPTEVSCAQLLNSVRSAYPTDKLVVALPQPEDQVMTFDGDLTEASDTGCGKGWNDMMGKLTDLTKAYDAPEYVWCGVLNSPLPTNSTAGGCGGQGGNALGRATFPNAFPATAMQEIGHAYGKDHTFEDSNWPAYGQPDAGGDQSPTRNSPDSIGEFGVDVPTLKLLGDANQNNILFDPTGTSDYMSYDGSPLWTSPYTYLDLWDAYFRNPLTVTGGGIFAMMPANRKQDYLHICGSIDLKTEQVKLKSSYHMPFRRINQPKGMMTNYSFRLIDKDKYVLYDIPIIMDFMYDMEIKLNHFLPYSKNIQTVQIYKEGKVVHELHRSENNVKISKLEIKKNKRELLIDWQGKSAKNQPLVYAALISYDKGIYWNKLKFGFRNPNFKYLLKNIYGGKNCVIKIVATDGFNTDVAFSKVFDMPIKAPKIVPLNFAEGGKLAINSTYDLAVQVLEYGLNDELKYELKWFVNNVEVGRGNSASIKISEKNNVIKVLLTGEDFKSKLEVKISGV
ncbi:MAG: IPT/TIG domain-containing protein [Ferruginibacter sp.]